MSYPDGHQRWLAVSARTTFEGTPPVAVRLTGVLADATERKRQHYLLGLSDALRTLSNPDELLGQALKQVGEYLDLDRVTYNEIDPAITHYTVRANYVRAGFASQVGVYPMDPFNQTVQNLRRGQTFVVNDAQGDPFNPAEKAIHRAKQVGAYVTVPLVKDGRWLCNLVAHSAQPRHWQQADITLLEETAERIWAAVERAKAEEALRASEDKYRTLYQSVDEGFTLIELIFNEEGQVVDFIYLETNPAFVKHVGLALQGKRRSELLLDQQDFVLAHYEHLARTGEPLHFEHHVPNLGGQWFQVTATRMGGEGSKLLGVVFRNITHRKQQEQRQAFLLTLSDQLRSLDDPLAILRAATQLVGELLQVDCALYNEVGEDGQSISIAGSYVRGNFPKVTGDYAVGQFGAALDGLRRGELLIIDDQTTTPLKSPSQPGASTGLRVMASATVPLIKQGHWVANFGVLQASPRHWREHELALLRETADRTWLAVERAKAQEALRESQKRFASIANLVPDLLWDSQPDGATNWYNQRWLDYTGQGLEEAVHWGWTQAIHPDDRDASVKGYSQAVASGQSLRQEHRIRRHDGAYRWFVVSASPLKDQTGQVVRMYGAATDIHESKQAEDALRLADRRKDEFLAMLAHELRNPLAPIRNGIQLVTQTHAQDSFLSTLLPVMNRQMEHLMRMVDDLLDVSRISQGKIELHKQRIDLGQVVDQTVRAMQPLYAASGRQLSVQLPTDPLYVDGDGTRLNQVVANLLSNGLRYTHDGGQVLLSLECLGEQAVLRVRDNGIGLAADQLTAIFALFVQVDTSLARSHGGLGVGLALVQQLVQLHGAE